MAATGRIEKKISEFFDSYGRHGLWLVGVSGGADSTALIVAMKACGLDCVALHCNFGLRGEESDSDEEFVRELCRMTETELIVTRFDTLKYRDEKRVSLEMACRDLRYDLFRQICRERGGNGIVVAHNLNDNAETMLLNLFRGTGIKGLRGMKQEANGIYRPLLDIERGEIEEYLDEKGVAYRTDSTNLENDFTRNRIRNVIMPLLRREFPGVDMSLELTRRHLEQTDDYLEEKLKEDEKRFTADNSIDVARILNNEKSGKFLVYSLLSERGLSASQIDNLADCVEKRISGKLFLTDDNTFLLDRGMLKTVDMDGKERNPMSFFSIEVIEKNDFAPDNSNRTAYFDADGIDTASLSARYWEKGDRMTVFGMKGTKKVSDIFNDRKVPLDKKKSIPILIYSDRILWIPEVIRCNQFPVTPETRKILKIYFLKNNKE